MNISALANTAQINSENLDGSSTRADYHVAVAQKIGDQIRREGEATVQLIESAPAPSIPASTRGRILNARV